MDLWVVERFFISYGKRTSDGYVGVFSTNAKAQEYISQQPDNNGYDYDISHCTIDQPID